MTKIDLAYRALKKLYPKLTQDSKTSMREMVACIGNARDEVLVKYAWDLRSADQTEDMVWGGCLSEYNQLQPTKDSRTGAWYIDLPFKVLQLPRNMGIYQVTPCNNSFEYYQVPNTFNSLFNDSPSINLEGNTGYSLKGDRVWFNRKQTENTRLDFLVVASSENIGEDEYFPFPPNLELQIIDRAVESYVLQKNTPEDLSDDNVSD